LTQETNKYDFNVLIVDDDAGFSRLLSFYIKSSGFKGDILSASNGQEAIDICKESFPGLILMDVHMPGVNGIIATRKIRCMGYEHPILIVSSWAEIEQDRCLAAGADQLILKPITRNDFIAHFMEFYPRKINKMVDRGRVQKKATSN
jgi:CheY-like chemotaxis protein